jgi:EAL domain-containing protein (putative c-di-GMP-specific phosphodiesterase class I)
LHLFNLANDLRRAINRNEFVLHYQPQIDLKSGRITGMEALIRWQRPGKGLVFPSDFIHEVETTGMIVVIGDWVLETACAQQKKWQEAGIAPALMAVNVSATQFYQRNMIGKVVDILHRTGLDPKALELELTENVVFKEDGMAFTTLIDLKKLGINISIDDFGTGYSSLSMLKKFPADKLKIVGSFVRSISINPVDSAIAKLIIDLSRVLSINVVAEGIETEEQLAFLCTAGCNAVQGYLFCRPVDATEATRLLTERTEAVSAQWAASRRGGEERNKE